MIGAAGLVLLLTGCATSVNTYERAESQAVARPVADKRIITNKTLAATFRVSAINQITVSGNLLKIQAAVENQKSSTRTLNFKFEWVDVNGMDVASPNETWKTLRFQGRESQTISTVAVSPRAVDFRLKFRE